MEINTGFWTDKKVLITGHTGFKGGWLTVWLRMLGAKVSGLSLLPDAEPNLFDSIDIINDINHHIADIRDPQQVKNILGETQAEIIIHMAAQSLVRHSYTHPVETFATNVMGTLHLLEATHTLDCTRVFINITSDKCYQNLETDHRYNESDRMGGNDPYSASKGCAELVTRAMRESFFDKGECFLASARAGNVFGGGDWAKDRLIPDLVSAFIKGETANIRNPSSIRPWQHVLNPLYGYMLLAEKLWSNGAEFAEGWNFGPEQDSECPVIDLVRMLSSTWGNDAKWQVVNNNESMKEAKNLNLDSHHAKSKLGWIPRWDLHQGLDETVRWYKAYANGQPMRAITEKQIDAYMSD